MKFHKYSGAGNDFVLIDNRDLTLTDYPALARRLCDRKNGIGADGLMVLEPPTLGGDVRMCFYNNDGSSAEMCGNGARCLCRHCYDFGISGPMQKVETQAGLVIGERLTRDQYRIRLNRPSEVSLQMLAENALCDYIVLGENGIPHAVVETNLSENRAILRDFARTLRYANEFPKGANVNLYEILSENELNLLTYERGVEDFTLACGTGTGATVYALHQRGLVCGKHTCVHVDGGTLFVDILDGEIYLSGPTERILSGDLPQMAK